MNNDFKVKDGVLVEPAIETLKAKIIERFPNDKVLERVLEIGEPQDLTKLLQVSEEKGFTNLSDFKPYLSQIVEDVILSRTVADEMDIYTENRNLCNVAALISVSEMQSKLDYKPELPVYYKGCQIENDTLVAYTEIKNGEKNIKLPEGIVKIGEGVGRYSTVLESIEFPSSLKTIKEYAFSLCSNLQKVILNEGLETIQEHTFCACNLKELKVPSTVQEIGPDVLKNNPKFTTLEIDLKNGSNPIPLSLPKELLSRCDIKISGFDGNFKKGEVLNNDRLYLAWRFKCSPEVEQFLKIASDESIKHATHGKTRELKDFKTAYQRVGKLLDKGEIPVEMFNEVKNTYMDIVKAYNEVSEQGKAQNKTQESKTCDLER